MSFGSLAISESRPMALRPGLTASLPFRELVSSMKLWLSLSQSKSRSQTAACQSGRLLTGPANTLAARNRASVCGDHYTTSRHVARGDARALSRSPNTRVHRRG